MGKIDFSGVAKRACLEHVPDVKIGEYVMVHVGFALVRIDEAEAKKVLDFLGRIKQGDDLGEPEPGAAPPAERAPAMTPPAGAPP